MYGTLQKILCDATMLRQKPLNIYFARSQLHDTMNMVFHEAHEAHEYDYDVSELLLKVLREMKTIKCF